MVSSPRARQASIWIRSASRRDEPKIVEDFLPGLTGGMNYTVAPLFGVDVCRPGSGSGAGSPDPEPIEGTFHGMRIFLQDPAPRLRGGRLANGRSAPNW